MRSRLALSQRGPGESFATAGRFAVGLLRVAALALSAVAVGMFIYVAARRLAYPYDLEWMEGGMLCHALRLLQGQPIYALPSVDFIPHLYTPLYPAVVAGLGWIAGDVSYPLARAVSLLSFLGAVAIGVEWAYREGGSASVALCALALPIAAFPVSGGWYDLARSDSLQLFLTVLGAQVAWYGRARHGRAVLAALLLLLAFLAKQTAAPLIVFVGVALLPSLFSGRRAVLTLALCGALLFGLALYLLDRASLGWFWTYIFRIHQAHPFFPRRAYVETPLVLIRALGPALILVPWALASGRHHGGLPFLAWLGLGGMITSCISFGTQWAHVNALIPGLFFPALAIGAAGGRLLSGGGGGKKERPPGVASGTLVRRALVFILLCGSLFSLLRSFHPAAHLPTAADRQAGAQVIARLRDAPGEVLIPFHPFYAHLAGKRTYLHRMGVWDVRDTMAGPVRGLTEALREQRFSRIIFDDKIQGTWSDWPAVRDFYHVVEHFRGPRTLEGAQTVPSLMLAPTPPVDPELQ